MGSTDSLQDRPRSSLVTAAEVRDATGYTSTRDVTDPAIESAIVRAQNAVLDDVAPLSRDVELAGTIDGLNTRFQVRGSARVIVDEDLSEASDAADVQVFLKDIGTGGAPPLYTEATVASVDGVHGIVTLDAAPASSIDAVLLTGRLVSSPMLKSALTDAILYFACAQVERRARVPGKSLLSNPDHGNQDPAPRGSAVKWMEHYRDAMRRLRMTRPQAATVKTSLPPRPHAEERPPVTDP